MLERTLEQKKIINVFLTASMLAMFTLAGMLIWRAGQLGGLDSSAAETFKLGPVSLFELGKTPVGEGFQATIAFRPGVLLYFLVWIVTIMLITIFMQRRNLNRKVKLS
jgi:hypothetical protein